MRYKTDREILDIVRSFEDTSIVRGAWGHPEHLIVALHYAIAHDLETAIEKMRSGIFKLLEAFKVDLTKEMPYHETLTVFWMRTVADFNATKNGASLAEKASELVESYDKDYPLRFYSREYLFSDEARAKFVNGDLGSTGPQASRLPTPVPTA